MYIMYIYINDNRNYIANVDEHTLLKATMLDYQKILYSLVIIYYIIK